MLPSAVPHVCREYSCHTGRRTTRQRRDSRKHGPRDSSRPPASVPLRNDDAHPLTTHSNHPHKSPKSQYLERRLLICVGSVISVISVFWLFAVACRASTRSSLTASTRSSLTASTRRTRRSPTRFHEEPVFTWSPRCLATGGSGAAQGAAARAGPQANAVQLRRHPARRGLVAMARRRGAHSVACVSHATWSVGAVTCSSPNGEGITMAPRFVHTPTGGQQCIVAKGTVPVRPARNVTAAVRCDCKRIVRYALSSSAICTACRAS